MGHPSAPGSKMGASSPLSDAIQSLPPAHSAVSTFWMANPNNNLINCAAAGSEVSRNIPFLGGAGGEETAGANPERCVP